MKIYTVDFELIIKNFVPYHESIKSIQSDKKDFADKVEKIKNEMESIVSTSKTLVLDQSMQATNTMRLRELQTQAIQLESEFRSMITQKQSDELEKNFNQIIDIVNNYADANKLDMVVNKNSVVFSKTEFDLTQSIIEIIKEKSLYKEYETLEVDLA